MDAKFKEFFATGLALVIVAGNFQPSHGESQEAIVHEDHTHKDPYQYEHVRARNYITLSSKMALSNLYSDLWKKVQNEAEYQKYLKILEEG
jgi:predicted ABC-class ATPase